MGDSGDRDRTDGADDGGSLKANPAPDKKLNQMAWVQHMNMLKAQAEEVILTELINS